VLSAFAYYPFAMITCVWWEQSRNQVEIPLLSRSWSLARNVRYSSKSLAVHFGVV